LIRAIRSFNGWGLTIVDSLDTMWLMGLYDEFDAGLAVVANVTFDMKPVRTGLPHVIIFVEGSLTCVYAAGVM